MKNRKKDLEKVDDSFKFERKPKEKSEAPEEKPELAIGKGKLPGKPGEEEDVKLRKTPKETEEKEELVEKKKTPKEKPSKKTKQKKGGQRH